MIKGEVKKDSTTAAQSLLRSKAINFQGGGREGHVRMCSVGKV